MTRGTEFGTAADDLGGQDSADHDKKKIADERKAGHYANKEAGHKARGDENKKDPNKRN